MRISEQDKRHAAHLGCKCEATCCGEIKRFRLAPRFAESGTKCCATQRFLGGFQRVLCVACCDIEQVLRIKPEAFQARPVGSAFLALGHCLPDPDPVALSRKAGNEREGEAGCRRVVGRGSGHNLMQSTPHQPAAKGRIDLLMSEPCAFVFYRGQNACAVPPDLGDRLAQRMQNRRR